MKPTLATYILPYLSPKNYSILYVRARAVNRADRQKRLAQEETEYLEREAGKFSSVVVPASTLRIAKPGDALL